VPLFFVLIRRLGQRIKGKGADFPAGGLSEPVLDREP